MDVLLAGFLGSLAAGLMTTVGALPVLAGRTVSPRASDGLLGFAAGVMLSASFFSLLIPAIDRAELLYGGAIVPALIAAAGLLLGAGAVALANERVPHQHFTKGHEGPDAVALKGIWLFVIAITIHNLPEGLARISQTTGMPSPGEFFCAWLGLSFRATACLAASGHAQRSASGGSTGHRCSSVVDGMGERRRLHRGGG